LGLTKSPPHWEQAGWGRRRRDWDEVEGLFDEELPLSEMEIKLTRRGELRVE
jgi:hypothetical protein